MVNPFASLSSNFKNKTFDRPVEKLYAQVAILSWTNMPRLDVFADIEEFPFPDHLIYTKPFADLLQDIARMNVFSNDIEQFLTERSDRLLGYISDARFISHYYKPRNVKSLFGNDWPGPGYYGLQITCRSNEHVPTIENT